MYHYFKKQLSTVDKWWLEKFVEIYRICEKWCRNLSKNAKFVEKYCRNREKWCLICEKWCRNLSKNAKFVEKCEICRKMMSNCRNGEKCCRKILSNYVELCRNRSKLRNLSKNIVEIAKNDVEVYRNGEICRNLSNNVEIFRNGEICRKRVFGFLPLYKERKAIHVVGPGALRRLSKTCFRIFPPHMKKKKSHSYCGKSIKKLLEKFQ